MDKLHHNWDHQVIADHLLQVFRRDESHLLLMAASDDTRRHNLTFVLDFENTIGKNFVNDFGGTVNYNKKTRRFDFVEYSDRHNFSVRISIASGAHCAAWDLRDFLYHNVPEAYYPEKKLSKWLLTH